MAAPAVLGVRAERSKFYEEIVEGLIAFAEHEFRLVRPLSDGAALRDHNDSAARQWAALGRKAKRVAAAPEGPACPPEVAYLMRWFNDVLSGTASDGMGPRVVTWQGLAAWSGLTGTPLDPWEARALVSLGVVYVNVNAPPPPTSPAPSPQPR